MAKKHKPTVVYPAPPADSTPDTLEEARRHREARSAFAKCKPEDISMLMSLMLHLGMDATLMAFEDAFPKVTVWVWPEGK